MRKIFCLFLLTLFMFLPFSDCWARREPEYIGKSVAVGANPGKIVRGDAKIWMVTLTSNGLSDPGAFLTIYDDYEGSAEANIKMEIEVGEASKSETVVLEYPIDVSTGMYVDVDGGTYLILYE